jgi:hypothetical protein
MVECLPSKHEVLSSTPKKKFKNLYFEYVLQVFLNSLKLEPYYHKFFHSCDRDTLSLLQIPSLAPLLPGVLGILSVVSLQACVLPGHQSVSWMDWGLGP